MDFKLIEKLVDMTLENKECPKGYKWCNVRKKCVPEDQKMSHKSTQEIFASDLPAEEKVEKVVDMILDNFDQEPNALQSQPIDNAGEQLDRVHRDLAGYDDENSKSKEYQTGCDNGDKEKFSSPEDYEDHEKEEHGYSSDEESEAHVKNMHPDMMNPKRYSSNIGDYISRESKDEYQTFFKKMMDKFGYTSIKNIPEDKKKTFFDAVDSVWKSDHEGKSIKESVKIELRSRINEIKNSIKK